MRYRDRHPTKLDRAILFVQSGLLVTFLSLKLVCTLSPNCHADTMRGCVSTEGSTHG